MSFDFDAAVSAPFRMQPGLRRLAPGTAQLTPSQPGSRHMREKMAVLCAFASQALLAEPGFDAGPALAALATQAMHEHPSQLQWDGQRAASPALGVAVESGDVLALSAGRFGLGDELTRCLSGLPPPWRLAGLLSLAFEEDFALLDGRDGRVPWLAVALPSHWAPETKLGLNFTQVHAPVADNARLLGASEALVKLVTGDERWERFVWTVADHPRLHAHPSRLAEQRWAGVDAGNAGERTWFRSERQTFIPVRTSRGDAQAVFTIHVEARRLGEVITTPQRAERLAAALGSMSDAVLAYRGLGAVREALLGWLRSRAVPSAA